MAPREQERSPAQQLTLAVGVAIAALLILGRLNAPSDETSAGQQPKDVGVAAPVAAISPPVETPPVAPPVPLGCGTPFADMSGGAQVFVTVGYSPDVPLTLDFGDGTGLMDAAVGVNSHSFTSSGTFTVTLAAADGTVQDDCRVEVPVPAAPTLRPFVPPGSVVVRCADGTLSDAGGQQGACSWHGGISQ